ncbi:MAG: hypothetical protein HIU86_09205 [Acidobacteria bacterium]|nr:hypothetical protein [Acidobacteriota bacterium]
MAGGRGAPRSDEVIRRFFAAQRRGVTGRRLERLRTAEADLRACLDEHAALVLTEQEVALLALERQFDPAGAASRVAEADAILLLLPLYLEESQWRGLDYEDRRLRIRLAEPLAYEVARLPELRGPEVGAAVWTVEATVEHAVWMLRQEREATRRN